MRVRVMLELDCGKFSAAFTTEQIKEEVAETITEALESLPFYIVPAAVHVVEVDRNWSN